MNNQPTHHSIRSETGSGSELGKNQHAAEVAQGQRFEFGQNWSRFLAALNDDRIAEAEKSLKAMLEVSDLHGKRFLDVGSGSGLFSLAARRLGALVYSFDYDPQSVACTQELRRRYFPDDPNWQVEEGSALDADFLKALGQFDIVYSWGVLHHTGAMWQALENVAPLVASDGILFLAIYNHQRIFSRLWTSVKKVYNRLPRQLKFLVLWPALIVIWAPATLRDIAKGKPFISWRNYAKHRGMSAWWDVVDWVGGYPFEVAKPEEIFYFYRQKGFILTQLFTCGGQHGCNQFVFQKKERPHEENGAVLSSKG